MAPVSITLQPVHAGAERARPAARVSVVLADDQPAFRECIEHALQQRPELTLVGVAADGREALTRIRELAPQVAVVDVWLPSLDGLQVVSALVRDHVPTRVLLLSTWADPQLAYRALQRGAAGYFRKAAGSDAILDAIGAVAGGRTVIDPDLQTHVLAQIRARR